VGQVTVFSGPERRRRWSDEERSQILTEAFSSGARVAEVARRHDISTGLIYTWRRKFYAAHAEPASPATPLTSFAEALVAEGERTAPAIVVDLAGGRRVSIFASASPSVVAAALKALR
jgi:transposase